MPRASIRRPLTISVWMIVSLACFVLSPVLLALAAIASKLMRRPQLLIGTRLIVAYFDRELPALVACGALWLASGCGLLMRRPRIQLLHWRLLRWFVHGLATLAISSLDITVRSESSTAAPRALAADGPLLIFSRHAGPGDTILLVDQLIAEFDRRPSVVFKEALALEPFIDLVGHRLPHAALNTEDRDECEAQIERLAAELTSRGALLLFPEGGNFTEERRRKALSNLRRKGKRRTAARGERMSHVLPPRPSGALAALRGNRGADVIFASHTGLGLAAYPRELWREMPIGRTLHTRMWLVPAAERPTEADDQVAWLFEWWKRIDDWIEGHGSES